MMRGHGGRDLAGGWWQDTEKQFGLVMGCFAVIGRHPMRVLRDVRTVVMHAMRCTVLS